jgi:hypothetical protein
MFSGEYVATCASGDCRYWGMSWTQNLSVRGGMQFTNFLCQLTVDIECMFNEGDLVIK